jgi:hypothetical protein
LVWIEEDDGDTGKYVCCASGQGQPLCV